MRLRELLEVRIITPSDPEPITDTETIRLYHGTSDLDTVVTALTHGITGDTLANRRYSYENNNNPQGLFMTPDLKTAEEFGDYVIEIHAQVHDLESPVWPNGTYTVQGGETGVFNSPDERESERSRQRSNYSSSELESIRNSDRPELAASLLDAREPQALYTGDLNSNSIRAVWVSRNPTRINQPYKRMKPGEFLRQFQTTGIPTRYGDNRSTIDDKSAVVRTAKNTMINPRDTATVKNITAGIQKRYPNQTIQKVIHILTTNPTAARQWVWSDRQYNELMQDLENY